MKLPMSTTNLYLRTKRFGDMLLITNKCNSRLGGDAQYR